MNTNTSPIAAWVASKSSRQVRVVIDGYRLLLVRIDIKRQLTGNKLISM